MKEEFRFDRLEYVSAGQWAHVYVEAETKEEAIKILRSREAAWENDWEYDDLEIDDVMDTEYHDDGGNDIDIEE